MVQQRDDVVLIDAAILSPPQVWQASGHLANFSDPLVDCTECKQRFRLDKLDDPDVCPNCDAKHSFTEAREFNLMFKTQAGPVEGTGADAYLRPETAQGMFTNFGRCCRPRARSRRSVSPRSARASATRSPRRTGSSGRASSSRWSSSSSYPLKPVGQWYEYWCDGSAELVRRARHPDGDAAPAGPRRRRVVALFEWHVRRRVLVPVGLRRAGGHRPALRLRPQAARRALRRAARLLRSADQRALRART